MASLPSPPLSPINHPYNSSKTVCPPKIGYRKTHRHPDRRRDTYEILQALMTEHQRIEQLEYENMLNDLPSISCNSMDNAPKGILVNKNNKNHQHKNHHENHQPHYIPTSTLPSISLPPLPPHDKNHHGSTTKLSSNDNNNNNHTTISLPSSPNQSVSSNTSSISIASSNNSNSNNNSNNNNNNNNSNNTRQYVRFASEPPKVYSYPRVQI
ncbi:unnamed protein product [Cunninghamella blakesleeana]